MTILANVLRSHTSNALKPVVTDTHYLKPLETMSRLIWKLYNNNMISIEIANELLDEHYR